MSRNIRDRDGKNLHIEEFELDEMCINPSIVMVAKRGSGKSWVTRAILRHFHDIPVGIIISPTDKMNVFYGNFFPSTYIYYEYDAEVIEQVLKRQEFIIDKQMEKKKRGKFVDARGFIIMDDCLASAQGWSKDQNIKELLFNGRHYQLMYILTMQFPLGIGPSLRSNFDYVFLLACENTSDLKRIYDHYAGMFPDFGSFRDVFAQLTAGYSSMVIINRGKKESFYDKIKWYEAPDLTHDEATYGCKQFRKYHERNYDPDWKKRKTKQSAEEYMQKKKRNRSKLGITKKPKYDNHGYRHGNRFSGSEHY